VNGWLIALLALAGWLVLSLLLALFIGRVIRLGQHDDTGRREPKPAPTREERPHGGMGHLRMPREIAE
jgi:hypothetical protein